MKILLKKYLLLILLCTSIINVNVFMPLSDNNTIVLALIELILPIIILYYFILIIKKKIKLNDFYKKIFIVLLIFFVWYVIISISRYFIGYEVKQSLLAIKVSIPAIIMILLIDKLKIDKYMIVKNLIIFNFLINIIQLFNFSNLRMSDFLGNIIVYLTLICMLFPINIQYFEEKETSIFIKIIIIFNVVCALLISLMVGSRSIVYVLFAYSIIIIIYLILNKKVKSLIVLLFGVFISFGGNYLIKNNTNYITYSERVLYTKKNSDIDKITKDDKDKFVSITEVEKEKSDNIRKKLMLDSWESIKKSPIIGEGVIYFSVDTDYGVKYQSAHNFVLEYINAYGIIGFMLFFIIHLIIMLKILLINYKDKNLIYIILSLSSVLVISLVQPTLLIVPIVFLYYILYGIFLKEEN